MSATEVVANMPLHSATVRVNKHKADWRGWKFMWPFALVFVFVFIVPTCTPFIFRSSRSR